MDNAISPDPQAPAPFDSPQQRIRWFWWPLFVLLVLIPTIWIGDISFINDEPNFVGMALRANHQGHWAELGLTGNQGRPYGPGAVWIYQVGTSLISDPLVLARVQTVVFMAFTVGSLAWIAWLTGIHPIWVLIIGSAPHLMHSARTYWDHGIPMAGFVAAATLHVIRRRSLWPIPFITFVCILMVLNHPMALALIAGMLGAVCVYGRAAFVGKKPWVHVAIAGSVILLMSWAWYVSTPFREAWMSAPVRHPVISSAPNGWWFTLFSPRVISSVWFDYFFPTGYLDHGRFAPWLAAAQYLSCGMFVLAWAGTILTVRAWRRNRDMLAIAGAVALFVWIGQTLLDGITHTYGHAHYYYATWVAPAILAGITFQALMRYKRPVGLAVAGLMLITQLAGTFLLAERVHETGGSRFEYRTHLAGYGPTLQNQIDVANTALAYPRNSPLQRRVLIFPHSLQLLMSWPPRQVAPGQRQPVTPLLLRYVHPDDPWDGRIELVPQPMPTADH